MGILNKKQKLSSADANKLRGLKPGVAIDFQLTFPNTTRRVRSEFIGADDRKILIFKFPDEKKYGPLRDGLYVDATIVVRLVLEETGEILAFKGKVKAITMSPIHAVWVLFPDVIQLQSLRANKRSQVRVPCELHSAKQGRLATGVVLDISASGCRVAVVRKGNPKVENKAISLEINAPGGNSDFDIKSEIMNVRMDETHFYYGLRFEDDHLAIDGLLERLMVIG